MNTYVPCVVGAFLTHSFKIKNVNIPNVVKENYNH